MPVSIVVSDTKLKVMSSTNNEITHWMAVDIPEEAVKDGLIVKPEVIAKLVKSVFTLLKLPRKNVSAALSGISFTYRTLRLPKIKNNILSEAVKRAAQKEINLPLEDLYIDWQVISQTENEITVFVLGMPRTQVDAMVQTAALADIELSSIEHNTLSLARTAGKTDCALIEAGNDSFDIIIISDGIPVTLHSVVPKNKQLSFEDKISQLSDELNRTIDYFNITHKDHRITQDSPVYICGDLIDDINDEDISQALGFPLARIAPSIKIPESLEMELYLANIGLLCKSSTKKLQSLICKHENIDVNLLAARKQALKQPVPVKRYLAFAAAGFAILLIIPLTLVKNNMTGENSELSNALQNANLLLMEEQSKAEQFQLISENISALEEETSALEKELEAIKGSGKVSESVSSITSLLPQNAVYSSISVYPDKITVEGEAVTRSDVITFINNLVNLNYFSEVRLLFIDESLLNDETTENRYVSFGIVIYR